jgi:tyrosine-protein phosphatase YwqE
MGLFQSLFTKKPFIQDFTFLGTDFHSHFLPGIDDGAETMEQSVQMLKAMADFGYKKVITTPHIMSDYYRNNKEIIAQKLNEVNKAAAQHNIPIKIEAAAEYYCDETLIKKVETNDILSFSDRYVLVELSFLHPSEFFDFVTFNLQMNGYKVVLAHPERYIYWQNSIEKIEALKDKGIYLQLNMGSLSGQYGSGVKRMAERLIELNLIDFVGTDAHKIEHIQNLEKLYTNSFFRQLVQSGKLLNSSL